MALCHGLNFRGRLSICGGGAFIPWQARLGKAIFPCSFRKLVIAPVPQRFEGFTEAIILPEVISKHKVSAGKSQFGVLYLCKFSLLYA
jgi:hypothetical protein